MKKTVTTLAISIAALVSVVLSAATASANTISSTVLEINGSVTQGDGANQSLSTTNPAKLTTPTGYDFSVDFSSLTSVMFIQVTLTMQDGNSSLTDGEGFDYNHLFLGLDGVNTGLVLNGFRGNGLQDTLTFSGVVNSTIGHGYNTERPVTVDTAIRIDFTLQGLHYCYPTRSTTSGPGTLGQAMPKASV